MLSSSHLLPSNPESPQILNRIETSIKSLNNRKERDSETWAIHQELTNLYRKLLLTDLDYALDKKIEQQLWNVCFKNHISELQATMKNKRSKGRGEAQVTLSWFLENATGFFLTLLEDLRMAFRLDIPFMQSGHPYVMRELDKGKKEITLPKKASCNYICQFCLVHLGDVARYRNEMLQAESFYRHAVSLAPGSGQPYNQIAILEASKGNKLSTVYYYIRAISTSCPFPAAGTNLAKLLSKLGGMEDGEERELRDRTAKVNSVTFLPLFLRVQGLLHHQAQLRHVVNSTKLLVESLTSLLASDTFTTWQLIQVCAINMWLYEHSIGGALSSPTSDDVEVVDTSHLSREERLCIAVCADLQAALLSAALLPIYTLKKGKDLIDYVALPAIRLILEWICLHPTILQEHGFVSRPQIWPGLARLLTEIEPETKDFDSSKFEEFPLPEDYDLQTFRPLSSYLMQFNCKQVAKKPIEGESTINTLRLCRLLALGKRLSSGKLVLLEEDENNEWRAVERPSSRVGQEAEVILAELEADQESESEDEDTSANESETPKIILDVAVNVGRTTPQLLSSPPSNEDNKSSLSRGILKSGGMGKTSPRYRSRQNCNVALTSILRAKRDCNDGAAEKEDSKNVQVKDEKDKDKKVMFQTTSPTNSQGNQNKDTDTSAGGSRLSIAEWGQPFSPAAGKAGISPQMSVHDLDMSKPPPSLHSNYRPPKLTQAGSGGIHIGEQTTAPGAMPMRGGAGMTDGAAVSHPGVSVMPPTLPLTPAAQPPSAISQSTLTFAPGQGSSTGIGMNFEMGLPNLEDLQLNWGPRPSHPNVPLYSQSAASGPGMSNVPSYAPATSLTVRSSSYLPGAQLPYHQVSPTNEQAGQSRPPAQIESQAGLPNFLAGNDPSQMSALPQQGPGLTYQNLPAGEEARVQSYSLFSSRWPAGPLINTSPRSQSDGAQKESREK